MKFLKTILLIVLTLIIAAGAGMIIWSVVKDKSVKEIVSEITPPTETAAAISQTPVTLMRGSNFVPDSVSLTAMAFPAAPVGSFSKVFEGTAVSGYQLGYPTRLDSGNGMTTVDLVSVKVEVLSEVLYLDNWNTNPTFTSGATVLKTVTGTSLSTILWKDYMTEAKFNELKSTSHMYIGVRFTTTYSGGKTGTFSTTPLTITSCVYDADKPKELPLPADPVKEGYVFTGWYTDAACTQKYDGTTVTEDVTLYAGFKKQTYNVSFLSNGGNSVSSITAEYMDVLTDLPVPTREGYNFKGWTLSDGTAYTNQPITSAITLTATWEIKTFIVTFVVLSDNGTEDVYTQFTVDWGTKLVSAVAQSGLDYMTVSSISTEGLTIKEPKTDFFSQTMQLSI